MKINLCNGLVGFNCRPGYYVSLKDEFEKNFLSLMIKTVGMDIKEDDILQGYFEKLSTN